MSGLNVPLGYFLATVAFAVSVRLLLSKWPRFGFITDFASAFMLVACRMEVQTIMDVGGWAGGLGPDVTYTILFVVLLTHGLVCGDATGNPSTVLQKFLQLETTPAAALLAVSAQFVGAHLGLSVAEHYWSLELTDMHMIKNLMAAACSTSLQVSLLQGFFTESVCALVFHLLHLNLRRAHTLLQAPLVALILTGFSYAASSHTAAYINPSLAYGLTFHCSGFTFAEYALVYWLGPLTGMTLALLLYMGHIPRIFSKNLLYSQKTRFRVPRGDKGDKKI